MKVEVKVPALGESITQATIGSLIKNSGSYVVEDDELVELETDKVNQVLYAPQAGVITWSVAKDDVVKIGQTIGVIDTDQAKPKQNAETKPSVPSVPKAPSAPQAAPKTSSISQEKPALPMPSISTPSPSAQTGARTSKEQFLADLSAPSLQPPSSSGISRSTVSPPSPLSEVERHTRKPMSKIRKVIASRLVDALQNTAMLTTFNEVDMSKIMALRDSFKDDFNKKFNARLGFMSFFIKASVSALAAFPEVNSYLDGEDLVYRNYFDFSIAVGTDRGVVVPVIRNCDKLSFAEIETSLESYAKKAREGKLVPDDLQGGGFTITNGGVYGSLLSTPILNMPQSAILGMHKIEKRPVVVNDEIVIRPMMYLALSYDHRVIDGKEAVSFLVHIKNALEDPSRLLIGV